MAWTNLRLDSASMFIQSKSDLIAQEQIVYVIIKTLKMRVTYAFLIARLNYKRLHSRPYGYYNCRATWKKRTTMNIQGEDTN